MNGLKYFAKLILFICSYLPLFIILLLNYWSNRLVLNIILISIVIFSLISWFILFYLLKDIDCRDGIVFEVIIISDGKNSQNMFRTILSQAKRYSNISFRVIALLSSSKKFCSLFVISSNTFRSLL